MGKRIAVSNQKGGVGKTTTAVNLASALTVYNKKVLLADMDAQGNACSGLGLSVSDDQPSMYNVLLMDMPVRETIIETSIKGLDLIPVNGHLSGAPIELADAEEREFRLYHALEEIKNEYDYIIIDCPPALDLLTLNGLTAADSVLIPIQCEYYALEGMSKLIKTIRLVQESLNPDLSIEGILLTMYDSRTNLSNQVVEEVTSYFKEKVFQTIIPRSVRISEAPSHGVPIDQYDPTGAGTKGYIKLAEELINHG
jgi:chromosome partitioning protein